MAIKRVFAGYYKRYDGKRIYVVRVVQDIDIGESIVVCKDVSLARERDVEYYTISLRSFCEQAKVDGELRNKYIRQTRCEIDHGIILEVSEDGFPEPKRKLFTYIDDEYKYRTVRREHSCYDYANDICTNYRMDLRRHKLIRERKQLIGVDSKEDYKAMCEDIAFLQQSIKTVLNDYAGLFQKRFAEGLSVRKAADAMQLNRGAVERRQAALYEAFSLLLQQRDEADGIKRISPDTSNFSASDDIENE